MKKFALCALALLLVVAPMKSSDCYYDASCEQAVDQQADQHDDDAAQPKSWLDYCREYKWHIACGAVVLATLAYAIYAAKSGQPVMLSTLPPTPAEEASGTIAEISKKLVDGTATQEDIGKLIDTTKAMREGTVAAATPAIPAVTPQAPVAGDKVVPTSTAIPTEPIVATPAAPIVPVSTVEPQQPVQQPNIDIAKGSVLLDKAIAFGEEVKREIDGNVVRFAEEVHSEGQVDQLNDAIIPADQSGTPTAQIYSTTGIVPESSTVTNVPNDQGEPASTIDWSSLEGLKKLWAQISATYVQSTESVIASDSDKSN